MRMGKGETGWCFSCVVIREGLLEVRCKQMPRRWGNRPWVEGRVCGQDSARRACRQPRYEGSEAWGRLVGLFIWRRSFKHKKRVTLWTTISIADYIFSMVIYKRIFDSSVVLSLMLPHLPWFIYLWLHHTWRGQTRCNFSSVVYEGIKKYFTAIRKLNFTNCLHSTQQEKRSTTYTFM